MAPLTPGALPDVWLQLGLGEVLRLERPARFVQLGAPPAFSAVGSLREEPRAALAFARAARASPSFAATLYARALARELAREPARLPGAPALALAQLGPAGGQLAFAPADSGAGASIRAAAEALGVPAPALELDPGPAASAGSGDGLVLLPSLACPAAAGPAAAEALAGFAARAAGGSRVLLAADLGPRCSQEAREALHRRFDAVAAGFPAGALWCGELRPAGPPGELGQACALFAAHLAPRTLATCRELGIRLAHALGSDPGAAGPFGDLEYAEA